MDPALLNLPLISHSHINYLPQKKHPNQIFMLCINNSIAKMTI